ncbi:MAG: ExeM/NucH family extracellular endonuclease [Bacteroidota bacterium]
MMMNFTKKTGFGALFILLLGMLPLVSVGQTTLLSEDFEDATLNYSPIITEFSDDAGDYFGRVASDGITIGTFVEYTNLQGSGFFGAQDTDGDGNPSSVSIALSQIDISGLTDFEISLFIAEDQSTDGNEDWDGDTQFLVEASIDGGAFFNVFAIEAEGGTNTVPRVDTDFDGIGDGDEITAEFTEFSASITGSGSTLDIRISFNELEAGDEDIAIDNIEVTGSTAMPAVRLVSIDLTTESITLENFGTTADISGYFICLGPGQYAQLTGYDGIMTGTTLSSESSIAIDLTTGPANVNELNGPNGEIVLFTTNTDGVNTGGAFFGSTTDPNLLVSYVQYGAGNDTRAQQAVDAGRWDDVENFVSGTAPYLFTGMGDDFGSDFWISSDPASVEIDTEELVEASLDGAEVTLELENDAFADDSFELDNFTLNGAPDGLSIENIELDDLDAILTMAYNGGNFDENISGFSITVDGEELFGSVDLTTSDFTIQAVQEENVSMSFTDVLEGQLLGRFQVGSPVDVFDESAAEIAAFDPQTNRLFFTDGDSDVIRVLDISNPMTPTEVAGSPVALAGGPNSVAVNSSLGIFAVAVEGDEVDDNGVVQFFNTSTLAQVGSNVTAGVLPDMLTFTPDGTKVLVANEGEPNDDYTIDPEGSISVITLPADLSTLSDTDVTQVSLTSLNGMEATFAAQQGRIFGPGATVAQDLEPEFIAITPDNNTAFVACQENNIMIVLDISTTTPSITDAFGLGLKDHSVAGNGLDASNDDNAINIARWPVFGMYQPDAIAVYNDGASNFIVTANEGDGREYEGTPGFVEVERGNDFDLNPANFPDADALQQEAALGRLEVTNVNGNGGDDEFEALWSFGARSFSIWDESGNQIWDSGNQLEVLTRMRNPEIFNTTNSENNFDNRSDDGGPEPEGVTLGEINGRTYAFIGLERISAVAIYDITDETAPTFAGYLINRDGSVDLDEDNPTEEALAQVGDLGPEGLVFIPSDLSPNGENLLVVTNEVTGTVAIWQVGEVPLPAGPITAINEDFDDACPEGLPEGWSIFNTDNELAGCSDPEDGDFIEFSGFSAGAGESFLLTPQLDLTEGRFILNFDYENEFGGPDPEILVSTDYPGTGDPRNFTFTNLTEATAIFATQTSGDAFENSGDIDLSDITSESVTIAFAYESLGSGGGNSLRIRVDNIFIGQSALFVDANFDDTCPELPEGFVEFNESLDLISCGGTDDQFIDFNGFGVGAGRSWLITPIVDFSAPEIFISFEYLNQFGGPAPEILFSTDYPGSGDPNGFTFTSIPELESIVGTGTDGAFLPIGDIDLSFIGEEAVIAFRYTSEGPGGGQSLRYRIDNLTIGLPVSIEPAGDRTISEIQGAGLESPFVGAPVSTSGIVTAIFDGNEPYTGAGFNSNLGGFFIQDSGDGDPMTSDGIFVSAAQSDLGVFLNVGDELSLNAVIQEIFGQTVLTSVTDIVVESTGNDLPEAVEVDLPVANAEDFERWEGMLVTVIDELTVQENRNIDNFGELRLGEGGRFLQPTQVIDVNNDPASGTSIQGSSNVGAILDTFDEIARRTIFLDDARAGSNNMPIPYLDGNNTVRAGSTVTGLSGVLNFDFGAYRIQPTEEPTINFAARPSVPDVNQEGDPTLKVVAFNVLNYFNGNGDGTGFPTSRGAGTFAEFQDQTAKIVSAIAELNSDVVGLTEIENDEDEENQSAIEDLVAALNAQLGAGTYDFIPTGVIGRANGTADEIKVAFIYKPSTVEAVGNHAILNNEFDPAYIDTQNRPALAQTFREIASDEMFTAVVNHFKSKGSDCDDPDFDFELEDPDLGDGQGNCNRTRTSAALVQSEWLTTDPTEMGDPDFLVIGDLNAYAQEDPIDAFRSTGFRLLSTEPDSSYSFIFDGNSGALDHILASPTISVQVTGSQTWHINADEPDILEYDGDSDFFSPNAFRSSDHDPLIVGLALDNTIAPPPVGDTLALSSQISSSVDDAEETSAGDLIDITSSDLEIVDDDFRGAGQIVGLRFNNIGIPRGATIVSSNIRFTVDEIDAIKNTEEIDLEIFIQDNSSPDPFSDTPGNISGRSYLENTVEWSPNVWAEVGDSGDDQTTPDLTGLVQAIIDREDWVAGNSIVFSIQGSGVRTAESFDGDESSAAILSIEFEDLGPQAPVLVREIPDITTRVNLGINLDLNPFFADSDSRILFNVEDASTGMIPGELTLENGILTGFFAAAAELTLIAQATSFGDTISDEFNITIEEAPANSVLSLAIFHNNDGESTVQPEQVVINGEETLAAGAGQFVQTLNEARTEAASANFESIMLSSGDNFLAGITFNISLQDGIFYDALLLDAIDYDAITLGNHDFDFGTDILADFINSFETNQAPYLSANLTFENEPRLDSLASADRILPSTVVNRGGQDIGIIGLTTPILASISSPGNTTIDQDVQTILQDEVDALEGEGVNIIILLSHLQGIDEDTALIRNITGVDVVIAGGGDELLSNNPVIGNPFNLPVEGEYPVVSQDADGNDVFFVTTAGNYRYLGDLKLDFDADGNVIEVVESSDVRLIVGDADSTIVEEIEVPTLPIPQVLATSVFDLDARNTTIRTGEGNLGNLVADALLFQARENANLFGVGTPDIALQNSGGIRTNVLLPAGDLTDVDLFNITPFNNQVSVIEGVTATQLKAIMERGVFEAPGANGVFPQISGFEVEYDVSQQAQVQDNMGIITTPGERVFAITLIEEDGTRVPLVERGQVVDGAPTVNMISNDFTFDGGDGYPFEQLGLTSFTTLGATYNQAFVNYITSPNGLNGVVDSSAYNPANLPIRLIPGTATANSAPTVANPIADIDQFSGFGTETVDLSSVFTDADGDALTLSAASSATNVVSVAVAGTTLTITEAGTGSSEITVTAVDGFGGTVSDVFTVTVSTLTGIEDLLLESLEIFPVPTSDVLYIRLGIVSASEIKLISLTGQDVIVMAPGNGSNVQLDLRSVDNGIYILQITDEVSGEVLRTRIIKD